MPKRPPLLPLAIAAVLAASIALAAILASSTGRSASSSRSSSAGPESGFDGAALPGDTIAPGFTLSDQYGRRASLGDYRGQVVVLAFLYSTCGATCNVIAQQIRGALDELEDERARPAAVLIVSADPTVDTPARVARFLSGVSLSARVHYLTGSVSRLRPIWAAYGIKPASAGAHKFDSYASVLLLDPAGRERVLFQSEQLTPESLSHDIRKLDGNSTHP